LLDSLLTEAEELVRIFAASIRTAEANRGNRGNAQRLTFNAQRPSGKPRAAPARASQPSPEEEAP
jgi:hypothetical protein